jgi:hypothetical protein
MLPCVNDTFPAEGGRRGLRRLDDSAIVPRLLSGVGQDFYDRPMVKRLNEMFGYPKPQKWITQESFDDYSGSALDKTARKQWHEIGQEDYWHYLLDMCYVDLQQSLFDHLFPAFLIRWWEGLLDRAGGPESECDFYRAMDAGQVFMKMIDETRREKTYAWMVDAYMEGVVAWSGKLSTRRVPNGPDDLHGPLWSFHALGQSVPITGMILEGLAEVGTQGHAQWWLVLASGIVWDQNKCPFVPPWTPKEGGGGIYITQSATSIYEHGYLDENLEALRSRLTYDHLLEMMRRSVGLLEGGPLGEWARMAVARLAADPEGIKKRIERLVELLELPDLGGVLVDSPLADP